MNLFREVFGNVWEPKSPPSNSSAMLVEWASMEKSPRSSNVVLLSKDSNFC